VKWALRPFEMVELIRFREQKRMTDGGYMTVHRYPQSRTHASIEAVKWIGEGAREADTHGWVPPPPEGDIRMPKLPKKPPCAPPPVPFQSPHTGWRCQGGSPAPRAPSTGPAAGARGRRQARREDGGRVWVGGLVGRRQPQPPKECIPEKEMISQLVVWQENRHTRIINGMA